LAFMISAKREKIPIFVTLFKKLRLLKGSAGSVPND